MKHLLRMLLSLSLAAAGLAMLAVLVYTLTALNSLPRLPDSLQDLEPPRQTEILDRHGVTLTRIGTTIPVEYEQVSPLFIDALLAAEDTDFFSHHGVDKRSLLRILIEPLLGRRRTGGSTITQQLVKNMFLTFEKRVDRKLREMLLAAQFEASYDKRDILQAYCNTVNFGSGCLGIESAAREYFGKSASGLDLKEAATLVAVLNAPGRLHPRLHPESCRQRRNWVINRMLSLGLIDRASAQQAMASEVLVQAARRRQYGHLRDAVLAELENYSALGQIDPQAIPYAGLVIHTTIDARLQDLAQHEVRKRCGELEERLPGNDYLQGAYVAGDPSTGEILAMVGGRDFSHSAYNLVTQARRQPGSSFKPLLYYTALREGWSPLDQVIDSVRTYDIGYGQYWTPRNWDNTETGPLTFAYGIMQSLNTVAAQVVLEVGANDMIPNARSAGVESPLDAVPSLALGSSVVRPLELLGLYSTFVNQGVYSEPHLLRHVEDARGRRLIRRRVEQKQALDPVECYLTVDLLCGAVKHGTGRALLAEQYPGELGGKTGTTNDYRDSWFCSVMPHLVSVSWVGYEDNKPMRYNSRQGVTGGGGALRIFKGLLPELERMYYDEQVFRVPEGVEFRRVDLISGAEDPEGARLALRLIDY